MTEQRALSVMRWLQEKLGENYDVSVYHNLTTEDYRVSIAHVDDGWPGLLIYKAINLEDAEIW